MEGLFRSSEAGMRMGLDAGGGGGRSGGSPSSAPPPQTPAVLSGWAPARKPADSSVRTAGSCDSAAICYLMRK